MKINVNQNCKVVLRQRGADVLSEYYSNMGKAHYYKAGDIFESPLWKIMFLFGKSSYMGPEPPFDTEVELENL